MSLDGEDMDGGQIDLEWVRVEIGCCCGVEYDHALVGGDVGRSEEVCVGRGCWYVIPVHLLEILGTGMSVRLMCGMAGTHELIGAKDGFAERGELDGLHGDLPEAVVLHARSAEGSCDDLMAKADT